MHLNIHQTNQFHQDIYDYFEQVGSINDVKAQNTTVVNIVDTIIQDAMAFVMQVTAILMAVVLVLTLRLTSKKINKQ